MVTGRTYKTKRMVEFAIIAALVVVIQAICTALSFLGIIAFSLALVPLVIGAAKHGVMAGTVLGFILGLINFITSFFNPFLVILFNSSPVLYILVCFGKTMLAGAVSAWIYKPFKKNKTLLGSCLSSIAAPIVNTGVFFIFMALFFQDAIIEASGGAAAGNVINFIIIYVITWNFFVELGVNLVFFPAVDRILRASSPRRVTNTIATPVETVAGEISESAEDTQAQ